MEVESAGDLNNDNLLNRYLKLKRQKRRCNHNVAKLNQFIRENNAKIWKELLLHFGVLLAGLVLRRLLLVGDCFFHLILV